jgi:acyl-CoA-binding protein
MIKNPEILLTALGVALVGSYGVLKRRLEALAEFKLAAMYFKLHSDHFSTGINNQLYAFYKQAITGDAPVDFDEPSGKLVAWQYLRGMSRYRAQLEYVNFLDCACPEWREESSEDPTLISAWASGSVPLQAIGEDLVGVDNSTGGIMCEKAATGDSNALKEMLKTHPVDTRDEDGMTCLHWAADRGHIDIVRMLLDSHASINVQDNDGNTPLHIAFYADQTEVVDLLRSRGADMGLANTDGDTVKDLIGFQE